MTMIIRISAALITWIIFVTLWFLVLLIGPITLIASIYKSIMNGIGLRTPEVDDKFGYDLFRLCWIAPIATLIYGKKINYE